VGTSRVERDGQVPSDILFSLPSFLCKQLKVKCKDPELPFISLALGGKLRGVNVTLNNQQQQFGEARVDPFTDNEFAANCCATHSSAYANIMVVPSHPEKAWVTLITRSSYLAGAVLLAHSIQIHKSRYPLLILYTDTLPQDCIDVLYREAMLSKAYVLQVDLLTPNANSKTSIAARFADTWTKLRVFELFQYSRLVVLDADMMLFRNMDELFDIKLPGKRGDSIAASHACVCNKDNDKWAPSDWRQDMCAYTGLVHPECLEECALVPKEGAVGYRRTHTLLNSGLFIIEPTRATWNGILDFLHNSPLVPEFLFPDQDLLAEYFRGNWISIGYQYNAFKTMRYWHPEMWRDEEICNVHYIVDKPWSKRVGSDGIAGYLGKDGETHNWWWNVFSRWEELRQKQGEVDILQVVRSHVAKPLVEGTEIEALHGDWMAT
jgi:inositol 3-alpha-galactosyltransferase